MRKGSLWWPLVLVAAGTILLANNFYPDLPLRHFFAQFWPWILILWGGFRLLEFLIAKLAGRVPPPPLAGGSIVLAVVIFLLGSAAHRHHARGSSPFPFGPAREWWFDSHEFPFNESATWKRDQTVVLRGLNGEIRISGADSDVVSAEGTGKTWGQPKDAAEKRLRPLFVDETEALVLQAASVDSEGREVSFSIGMQVPREARLRVENSPAALSIRGLLQGVTVEGSPRQVRIEELSGPVQLSLHGTPELEVSNLAGDLSLTGQVRHAKLEAIAGEVTVDGSISSGITVENVGHLRLTTRNSELELAALPGSAKLSREAVLVDEADGPLALRLHGSKNVEVRELRGEAVIQTRRGDVLVAPAEGRLGSIDIQVEHGNIEIVLDAGQEFRIEAQTDHGRIDSDFSSLVSVDAGGDARTLQGSIGQGPQIRLATGRGNIQIRRAGAADNNGEKAESGDVRL